MTSSVTASQCTCGSDPVVDKKGRIWKVKCSKYEDYLSVCRQQGHPMHSKGQAIVEWNK